MAVMTASDCKRCDGCCGFETVVIGRVISRSLAQIIAVMVAVMMWRLFGHLFFESSPVGGTAILQSLTNLQMMSILVSLVRFAGARVGGPLRQKKTEGHAA